MRPPPDARSGPERRPPRVAAAKQANTSILDDACAYRAAGWSVIPCSIATKLPLVRWREWQHRAPDVEQLREWFAPSRKANLAVVTGRVSGIVVIDVDPRHGGEAGLAQLERAHGDLPWAAVTETPSGGQHIYLAHPGFRVANSVGKAPGVDVRGDGGYVLAPPSRLRRTRLRDDRIYRWAIGGPATVPPMPAGWRKLLRPRPQRPLSAPQAPDGSRDAARLAGLLRTLQRAPEGQRNSTLYWCGRRLAELLDQGAPPSWADVLQRAGVAAGLDPGEVRDTIASALGRQP